MTRVIYFAPMLISSLPFNIPSTPVRGTARELSNQQSCAYITLFDPNDYLSARPVEFVNRSDLDNGWHTNSGNLHREGSFCVSPAR